MKTTKGLAIRRFCADCAGTALGGDALHDIPLCFMAVLEAESFEVSQ